MAAFGVGGAGGGFVGRRWGGVATLAPGATADAAPSGAGRGAGLGGAAKSGCRFAKPKPVVASGADPCARLAGTTSAMAAPARRAPGAGQCLGPAGAALAGRWTPAAAASLVAPCAGCACADLGAVGRGAAGVDSPKPGRARPFA